MQPLVELISETSYPLSPLPTTVSPKLPKLSEIKCVIFDVYGTLMVSGVGDISHSTGENRNAGILRVLRDLGLPLHPRIEDPGSIFKSLILQHQDMVRSKGVSHPEVDIREVWLDFLNQCSSIESITTHEHPLIEELSIRYELAVNPTWPMPGLDAILYDLRASGVILGIVSNAQFFTPLLFNAYLNRSLEELGFEDEICQWSYFYKEAKPSERLYRINAEILRTKWNIEPEQTLYVGNDMLNDITPANALGYKTALFAGDKRSLRLRENDARVKGVVPDLVIETLDQIQNCIL